MRNIFIGIAISIGLLCQAATTTAFAGCRTVYGAPYCAETNANGSCKRMERSQSQVCTDEGSGAHVSPPTKYCYSCTSNNRDGTCRTTTRYAC